jgi:uncharacterized membrane protein YkoI
LSTGPVWAADESPPSVSAEAKIAQDSAAKIALARVPGGTIESAELEKEHGKLVWSFDIASPNSRNITEVQVDAATGKVVAEEIETPQDEAAEAASEKK